MTPNLKTSKPIGTCPNCGINCWPETGGKPAVWPCGVGGCPYPTAQIIQFPQSFTGSSLLQIVGN